MKTLGKSIVLIAKGAGRSFQEYPAAMASALLFTLVALVRIQMGWPAQETYDFLFATLQLSLGLGAVFSLAAIAFAKSRFDNTKSFMLANIISAAVVIGTFLILFYFSGVTNSSAGSVVSVGKLLYLSDMAVIRVMAAIFISLLAFILIAACPKNQSESQANEQIKAHSDVAGSLFMVHKAFFIALLYEVVMYAGASAVAGAIKGLLYRDMSSKVFLYIGVLTAFLAYAIFIGYFPNFGKTTRDQAETMEKREIAQRQPKFIQVLFDYIMVPLLLALTLVLLIWSVKTVVGGEDVSFMVLYSVAAGYGIVGLRLYIMVTHSQAKTAIFYRRIYPFAALVILAFEARALIVQLDKWGPKTAEYWFGIILIVSVIAALVLIIKREKAYTAIVLVIMAATVISVLPWLGYQDLPVMVQTSRLEYLLSSEGMLSGNQIVHSDHETDREAKEAITDAVNFLLASESSKKPAWLDERLGDYSYFQEVFGFEQTWPDYEGDQDIYEGTYFMLSDGHVDIKDYQWAVHLSNSGAKSSAFVEGEKGDYNIAFHSTYGIQTPILTIERDGREILREDLTAYLEKLKLDYYAKSKVGAETSIEEMSVEFENEEVKALLVLSYISVNTNTMTGKVEYYTDASMVFLDEKK